jgi:hypothetical protein
LHLVELLFSALYFTFCILFSENKNQFLYLILKGDVNLNTHPR